MTSTRFRWLVLATLVATYGLIIVGAFVRATGSGDACPDWPTCHGELLPPLDYHVLIEFSHRLLASVVGFLVLGTAIAAWRGDRSSRVIVWGSTLAVALVIAQIILGGLTVLNDLSANLVTAHLSLAAALLATFVVLAIASFRPLGSFQLRGEPFSFRNLAAVAAIATFLLMLTGSYVSGSGAGLAFRDWPLFDGKLMPDGGRLAMIHVTHRLAAAAVGVVIGYLALQAWRTQRANSAVVLASAAALALYVAQIFVGAAQIWTLLKPPAVAAHLALATALWAALVADTLLANQAAQEAPTRTLERQQRAKAAAGALPARRTS
ncbi:MAG: COX15/CtaA family protein [Dehalococcoidia bacterium]